MKKIIYLVIVIAIAIPAGLYLKSQKDKVASLPVAKARLYSVTTTKAETKELKESRHFLAQLLASKSAFVASKFSAKIQKIHVKENDIVKKGELLISLDNRETQANISSLEKQKEALTLDVANIKRSLARNKKLLEAEAISQEKYDNTKVLYQTKLSSLSATQEKIKQAQAQLSYLNIKAPFSGRVGSIIVDEGNLAIPGKAILSINSDDQKLVFSYVASSQNIVEGDTVLVDGKEVGHISRRYDDAKNALLVAEVKLTKSLAFANKAFVNIDVVTAKLTGCTLPLNAFLHKKEGDFIMLYKENRFTPLQVEVLLENSDEAIIKECPEENIATASEAKLALLPSIGEVIVSQEH